VLDVLFIALTLIFFVISLGYVAMCDRLMRWACHGRRIRDCPAGGDGAAGVPRGRPGDAGAVL